MSMYSISHYCTIPVSHIRAANLDDLFLVWTDGDESSYYLADFQDHIGECFSFWAGPCIRIDPIVRENSVLKHYSNRILDRRGDLEEIIFYGFPELARQNNVTVEDISDYRKGGWNDQVEYMQEDFFEMLHKMPRIENLGRHVANRLTGMAGTMVMETREANSQSLFSGNDIKIPGGFVTTLEEIDLKTGKVKLIIKNITADVNDRYEFRDFQIFWSNFGKLANVMCELRMQLESATGYNFKHVPGLYHVTGKLRNVKAVDGDLTMTRNGETVWRGSDSSEFVKILNGILKQHAAGSANWMKRQNL